MASSPRVHCRRSIDIHAHLMPPQFWQAVDQGQSWYGVRYEQAADRGWTVSPGGRNPVLTPKLRFTPEERLRDMDEQGVDVQVISVATPLFGYYLDAAQGRQMARKGRLLPKKFVIEDSQSINLLIRDNRQIKTLTNLSQAQFYHLLPVFSDIYQTTQQHTYETDVASFTETA